MKMKFIINDILLYCPDEYKLSPLGVRGSETVLHAPVSRCLLLLLQHPGTVISQEEIFREVWEKHGQYVTANTLYQNVSLLRKGMRNAGVLTSIIKTVPKVGFVFKGKVQVLEEEIMYPAQNDIVNLQPALAKNVSTNTSTVQSESPVQQMLSVDNNTDPLIKRRWSLSHLLKGNSSVHFFYSSLLFAITLFLLTMSPAQSIRFFNTHKKIAEINQCSVYIDRDFLQKNLNENLDTLKARNLVCGPEQFVYITRTATHDNMLVLFCDTNAEKDMRCATRFTITS